MSDIYTFERFISNTLLGEWEEPLSDELQTQWKTIFGDHPADAPAQGAGLAVACMMRAYLGVVTPRPPGNIHARQVLILDNLPQANETIRSQVWCVDKEIRKERNYLTIAVIASGEGDRSLYTGKLSLIWAR